MGSILNDERNAQRLLKMTAGTLILLDESGNCIDIQVQDEGLWFLNEKLLKGQNLFNLFPQETYRQLYPNFRDVLTRKCVSSQSYEMKLNDQTYYFRCTMQPYDNLVLCQYKDITESSIQRREILKRNKELDEIKQRNLPKTEVYTVIAELIDKYIHQNYRNPISIDMLCKEFSFSKNHIINIFFNSKINFHWNIATNSTIK